MPLFTYPNNTVKKINPDLLAIDVKPYGSPSTARLAMFAEAPSTQEMMQKEPIVGPSWGVLQRVLSSSGLARHELYIANFCDTQLEGNNTDKLWTPKGFYSPEFDQLRTRMIERMNSLATNVIMLLGTTPLHALFPFHKISNWRGSILTHPEVPGKYLIPTFHPAFCLPGRAPEHMYTISLDIRKALRVSKNGPITPEIEVILKPSLSQVVEALTEILTHPDPITAFDIETIGMNISCIGLTINKFSKVICIPFTDVNGLYWSPQDEVIVWRYIAAVLESPKVRKIAQNGMFDITALYTMMGIKTANYWFDTMLMHQLCWADLPKGLDYLVSIYSDFPYYKNEGKDWRVVYNNDYQRHWNYNAKDAAYTHYISSKIMEEIDSLDCHYTANMLMELHKPLLEMTTRGMAVDLPMRELMISSMEQETISALTRVREMVGNPSFSPDSPKQMQDYFYKTCNLPPYKDRKTNAITCDAKALTRIAAKNLSCSPVAKNILTYKKTAKLLSTYFRQPLGPDGRFRCEFKISGTDTGRLASGQSIFGYGTNMQNLPSKYKKILVPDPNMLLIEGDLKQAESMVVAYLSQDPNMLRIFDEGLDGHVFNAAMLYDRQYQDLYDSYHSGDPTSKEQRQMGKKVAHGANYNMGAGTLAVNIDRSIAEARVLIDKYHARFPGLRRWHQALKAQVSNTRMLYNLFGRPKRFLGYMDDDLFRQCFAFIPQSTVGECMTRALRNFSKTYSMYHIHQIQPLSTVHDSFLWQCPINIYPDLAEGISLMLTGIIKVFALPLNAKGRAFSIPMDFKIGFAWGNMEELTDITPATIRKALDKIFSRNLPAIGGN